MLRSGVVDVAKNGITQVRDGGCIVTHMSDYDQLDLALLHTIDQIRDDHNACTARAVANALNYSPDVVRYRLQKLMNDGLVTWTDMPGSLTRLALPPLAEVPSEPATEETPDPEPVKAPAKKAPAKKRAGTKGAKPSGSA